MRIAMVSEHASPLATLGGADGGGQNVHVAKLADALVALGVQVDVYTRRDDAALPSVVTMPGGARVVHVDAGPPVTMPKDQLLPYMPEFAAVLARHWERRRPDVAHAHFWMSGLAATIAARALQVSTALTFHALGSEKHRHQSEKDTSPRARIGLERWLVRNVDRVLATSNAEVFELLRMGAPKEVLHVVPCGVDVESFTPIASRAPRSPGRARVVVVSRMVERKGIGNVIEAIAGLPDVELIVAGGPPAERLGDDLEATRLRAVVDRLGLAERVRFLGAIGRAEVPALLRSADVAICAPWYEPFGLVPLEAMACGIPVVATAVGGIVDTVIDGVTGLLVPPRDPAALRGALAALLADPAMRRQMGRAGVERAAAYAWERVAEATLLAYPSAVGTPAALGRARAVR